MVSRHNDFRDFKKNPAAVTSAAMKGVSHRTAAPAAVSGAAVVHTSTPVSAPVVVQKKNAAATGGSNSLPPPPPVPTKVLQRPASSATSYAHAASTTAASGHASKANEPNVTEVDGSNAGHKLLKVLQKVHKQQTADGAAAPPAVPVAGSGDIPALSQSNKIAILKKKIGIPDKPAAVPVGVDAVEKAGAASSASNGTGVNILAEAAGYSIADMASTQSLLPSAASLLSSHNLMMGVISYQAQQATGLNKSSLTTAPNQPPVTTAAPAAAVSSAAPATTAPAVLRKPAVQSTAHSGPTKMVLNKDATRRIVAHELAPNSSTAPVVPDKPKVAIKKPAHIVGTVNTEGGSEKKTKTVEKKVTTAAAVAVVDVDKVVPPHSALETSASPPAAVAAPVVPVLSMKDKLAKAKLAMVEKQKEILRLKQLEKDGEISKEGGGGSDSSATAKLAAGVNTETVTVAAVPKKLSGAPKHKEGGVPVASDAPLAVTASTAQSNLMSMLMKAKSSKQTNETIAPVTKEGGVEEATAAPTVSITSMLKNAKRAPAAGTPTSAVADAPGVEAKDVGDSAPAAPTKSTSAAAVDTATVATKKKVTSNLVPSRVLIAKKV